MSYFKKIINLTLLLIFLLVQLSCSQQTIENKNILNKYADGKILREQVKYRDNDTLVQFTYFKNGKLNYKMQLLNNQRVGYFFTYNKKEELTMKVVYQSPCDFGSCKCDEAVTVYENGSNIYSYEVNKGLKSENHTIYDQVSYQKLVAENNKVAENENGKTLFHINCGMCHKTENQLVGIALNSFSKTMNADELVEILGGSKGHPWTRTNKKEAEELIEYINKICD